MLTRNHQLTNQEFIDLDSLSAACKLKDGNNVAIYKHLLSQNRPRLCNVLYYHQKQLIGFLSTFFFYGDACEITVMVAPDYRKRGIATQMLKEILPLIQSENIKSLIFSTPHDVNNEWLLAKDFRYLHSEYQMEQQQHYPLPIANKSLVVRFATMDDLAFICAIDDACFPTHQPELAIHIQNQLYDPNYKMPQFQKHGFGSTMLAHAVNYSLAANQPKLSLTVEAKNQQALKIYSRLGFKIENAHDFWSIPMEVLRLAKH
jgi:RimJ/RimL family protein N-acetyltransferase